MSDLRHDEVRTLNTMLDALNCKEVNGLIQAMTQMGHSIIKKSKAQLDATESVIELDMLYMGQTHAVAVPIPSDKPISPDLIRAAFEATYLKTYSRLLDQIPIRILNLRLSVIGKRPQIDIKMLARGKRAESVAACYLADQKIFANGAWHDAGIYDRLLLPQGSKILGPALLVQPDATIYVDPGLSAEVDDFGNIIMKSEED